MSSFLTPSDVSWTLCDELEGYKEKQSFLPARVLRRTVKNVIQLEARKRSDTRGASMSHSSASRSRTQSFAQRPANGARSKPPSSAADGASLSTRKKGATGGSDQQ
jgi:hypothetical protein